MLAAVLGWVLPCQSTPSLLHKRPKGRFGLHAIVYTYDSFAVIVEVAPGTNAMAATLNIDTGAAAGNRMWKILVKCVECDSADR